MNADDAWLDSKELRNVSDDLEDVYLVPKHYTHAQEHVSGSELWLVRIVQERKIVRTTLYHFDSKIGTTVYNPYFVEHL